MTTVLDAPESTPASTATRLHELEARVERQAVGRDAWTLFIVVKAS